MPPPGSVLSCPNHVDNVTHRVYFLQNDAIWAVGSFPVEFCRYCHCQYNTLGEGLTLIYEATTVSDGFSLPIGGDQLLLPVFMYIHLRDTDVDGQCF